MEASGYRIQPGDSALWTQEQVNPKILGASLLTHVVVSVVGHPFRDAGSFHIGMLPSCRGLQVFQGKGESGGGNFLTQKWMWFM